MDYLWIPIFYVGWLLASVAWFPVAARTFPGARDSGWAGSRLFGLILPAWIGWFAAATFGSVSPYLGIGFAILLLAGLANAWIDREFVAALWRTQRRRVLVAESLMLTTFLGLLAVRGCFPAITWVIGDHAAEKFTDMSVFAAAWTTPVIPPEDSWLAGSTLNYYYFGHWVWASWGRLAGGLSPWGASQAVAYNVAVCAGWSLAALLVYALLSHLTRRRWLAIIGAGLLLAGGNPLSFGSFWVSLRHYGFAQTFQSFDLWGPSRAITNTITEFPAFSFLLGDLHAHTHGLLLLLGLLCSLVALFAPDRDAVDRLATAMRDVVEGTAESTALVDHDNDAAGDHADAASADGLLDPRALPTLPEPTMPGILPLGHGALLIGAMGATNSWDVISSGVLVLALLLLAGPRRSLVDRAAGLAVYSIVALLGLFVLFGPFWLSFRPPMVAGGLEQQQGTILSSLPFTLNSSELRSPLSEFLGHWSAMLLLMMTTTATWLAIRLGRGWVDTSSSRMWRLAAGWAVALAAVVWIATALPADAPGDDVVRLSPHWLSGLLAVGVLAIPFLTGWEGPRGRVLVALATASCALLFVAEVIHLNDQFSGEIARINTVFKIYYAVWPMLGIAALGSLGLLLDELVSLRSWKLWAARCGVGAALLLWTITALPYPIVAAASRYHQAAPQRAVAGWTLDGWAFAEALDDRAMTADYRLLRTLSAMELATSDRPLVLEASTGTYNATARFATNLGWVSWIGWQQHVWTWRGPALLDLVGERVAYVDDLYAMADADLLRAELEYRGFDVIIWGALEQRRMGAEAFLTLQSALSDWVVVEATVDGGNEAAAGERARIVREERSFAFIRPAILRTLPD